ncbi:hypothetical protein ACIQOU_35615 [Streptomyces sp. NPDC091279]|uniref:hypothetical protein n=1 Tax=Streptomyces sp. NPDC091279 TaxID=3365983 RepID=UPI0037F9B315
MHEAAGLAVGQNIGMKQAGALIAARVNPSLMACAVIAAAAGLHRWATAMAASGGIRSSL